MDQQFTPYPNYAPAQALPLSASTSNNALGRKPSYDQLIEQNEQLSRENFALKLELLYAQSCQVNAMLGTQFQVPPDQTALENHIRSLYEEQGMLKNKVKEQEATINRLEQELKDFRTQVGIARSYLDLDGPMSVFRWQ